MVDGETTRLRPASWGFSDEELRRRYQWSLDDVLQYWSGTIPSARSLSQFREIIAQRDWPDDGHRISYAILSKDDDQLIGMVSCYSIDWKNRDGELGVYIGDRNLWGHGYGTDAVVAFLRHLFSDLQFEMVYLHTYESNVRAQRSYLRVGFEAVETRRRYSPRIGYHEEVKMTIDRHRFAELHGLKEPVVTG
jgi:RimJ/RimL family protein N-acetyltransferase